MSGMTTLRNIGQSKWRHPRGGVVLPNALFEVDDSLLSRMQVRKQLGTRFEIVDESVMAAADAEAQVIDTGDAIIGMSDEVVGGSQEAESVEAADGEEDDAGDAGGDFDVEFSGDDSREEESDGDDDEEEGVEYLPEWPLKMRPGTYLSLHPTGKHSDLAQQYVDAEDEEAEEPED